MTLIVGVLCEGGAVVGADGAVTLGPAPGRATIRQTYSKKLSLIKDRVIVGVSGHVGLAQIMKWQIEREYTKIMQSHDHVPTMLATTEFIRPHVLNALSASNGQTVCGSIIATWVADNKPPLMFQTDPWGNGEQVTEELPFVAIGSGQPIADPFIAFLRRVYWKNANKPTLEEGLTSVLWTLRHAIDTHPGGVTDPMQIMVLEKVKTGALLKWQARELKPEENEEHVERFTANEEKIRKVLRGEADAEEEETAAPLPELGAQPPPAGAPAGPQATG